MAEPYKGQYGSLKFPPFEYQEYPKYIRDAAGKILGVAQNAREEREMLANAGVEEKVDPVLAERNDALDEVARLKERLAKYEGDAGVKQVASPIKVESGPKTQTVEILPAETPKAEPPKAEPAPAPTGAKPNPLLGKATLTPGV